MYETRIKRELAHLSSVYEPKLSNKIISKNLKTGLSINFPLLTCNPTKLCSQVCYATRGPITLLPSINKSLWILDNITKGNIEQIDVYKELPKNSTYLRWCGSGDLTPAICNLINTFVIQYPHVKNIVYSRKKDVNLLLDKSNLVVNFTLDATSMNRMNWPTGKVKFVFLRQAGEDVPSGIRVVFPVKLGPKYTSYRNRKDCPCDAGKIPLRGACAKCRKCYK